MVVNTMKHFAEQKPDRTFVSINGTDLCVICGTDTGIPTDTPIHLRVGYVEGCGQCCDVCSEDD
jgi:hypothetical protein